MTETALKRNKIAQMENSVILCFLVMFGNFFYLRNNFVHNQERYSACGLFSFGLL